MTQPFWLYRVTAAVKRLEAPLFSQLGHVTWLLGSSIGGVRHLSGLARSTAQQILAARSTCPFQMAQGNAAAAGLFWSPVRYKTKVKVPGLKYYKPTSPGRRHRVTIDYKFYNIYRGRPKRGLVKGVNKTGGRNRTGRITVRHRGGGRRKVVRMVSFRRPPDHVAPVVERLEYDPGRTGFIALVKYPQTGEGQRQHAYILAAQDIGPGTVIKSGPDAAVKPGNILPLKDIPPGVPICNLELYPGRGGQLVRAAGTSAIIINKQDKYALVRLPSKEERLLNLACCATIGSVSNPQNHNQVLGKAGAKRWRGIRPTVRGEAMNPVDHPHGGSTKGGRPEVTPWGWPTKCGFKTRQKGKPSDKMILKRSAEARKQLKAKR